MQRQHSFLKKTRKGKILKVVQEHYLRDDISCGSLLCQECVVPFTVNRLSSQPISKLGSSNPSTIGESLNNKNKINYQVQYIIIDTNVALHQIDALEHSHFENIILLQTGKKFNLFNLI